MRTDPGHGGRRKPAVPADTAGRRERVAPEEVQLTGESLRIALDVELPSDVRYIERVVELVRRQCEELGYGRHQLMLNVPVALSEALSNAILRGNDGHPEYPVRVLAVADEERLVLEVHDHGEGFDLEACSVDPTTPENIYLECGRGLFLMRKLMDRVERFDAADRTGNVVRLVLHRA